MARYFIDIGLYDPFSRYNNVTEARIEILRIRDLFRAALDPDGLQTKWQVTDIHAWSGSLSGSEAYGFEIFLMDGGAPSSRVGPSWWLAWSGASSVSTSILEFEEYTSNQHDDYFRDTSSSTSFGTDGQHAIHYNNTGVSTPYGTGVALDGTLSGGDFTAPSISPQTSIQTFIPAGKVYGLVSSITYGMTSVSGGSRAVFVLDDVKPFLACYNTPANENYTSSIRILGDLVVPYRPTDTFTQVSFHYSFNVTGNPINRSHYILDDTGALLTVDDEFSEYYTRENVPFADGTYPWDVVSLANSTYFKGYLDSDAIRVMGPFDGRYYAQFNGGEFIKYHEALCFPYAPGQPSFPYPDPTDVR